MCPESCSQAGSCQSTLCVMVCLVDRLVLFTCATSHLFWPHLHSSVWCLLHILFFCQSFFFMNTSVASLSSSVASLSSSVASLSSSVASLSSKSFPFHSSPIQSAYSSFARQSSSLQLCPGSNRLNDENDCSQVRSV